MIAWRMHPYQQSTGSEPLEKGSNYLYRVIEFNYGITGNSDLGSQGVKALSEGLISSKSLKALDLENKVKEGEFALE